MTRGYRIITRRLVLAVVAGWLVIGLTPPSVPVAGIASRAEIANLRSDISDPIAAKRQPTPKKSPCRAGFEDRGSELCAQWKAADAAAMAATWAMIGTVVAVLGTGGLLWQIHLTRRALHHNTVAAELMNEANAIALGAQRAWLTLDLRPQWIELDEYGFQYYLRLVAENIGSTAATKFSLHGEICFGDEIETERQLDQWRQQRVQGMLPPGAAHITRVAGFISERKFNFTEDGNGRMRCYPRVLIAAFYETVAAPSQFCEVYRWIEIGEMSRQHIVAGVTKNAGRIDGDNVMVIPFAHESRLP